jgi:hypothetical protein
VTLRLPGEHFFRGCTTIVRRCNSDGTKLFLPLSMPQGKRSRVAPERLFFLSHSGSAVASGRQPPTHRLGIRAMTSDTEIWQERIDDLQCVEAGAYRRERESTRGWEWRFHPPRLPRRPVQPAGEVRLSRKTMCLRPGLFPSLSLSADHFASLRPHPRQDVLDALANLPPTGRRRTEGRTTGSRQVRISFCGYENGTSQLIH